MLFKLLPLCFALPSYHYQGIMLPPNDQWVMYEPYKEFLVQKQLCRAFDQPRCTWWNAMLLTGMNKSAQRWTNQSYYHNVPWSSGKHLSLRAGLNESECVSWCVLRKCTAFEWWRNYDTCLFTMDTVALNDSALSVRHLAKQKIPMRKPYVAREAIHPRDIHTFVNMLLTEFDCNLNKFRCAR